MPRPPYVYIYTAVLAGEGLVFSSSDLSLVASVTVDWTTLIVVVHCG